MNNFHDFCRQALQGQFDAQTFNAFIAPTVFALTDGNLTLAVPNAATERWMRKNTEAALKQAIKAELGEEVQVVYRINPNAPLAPATPVAGRTTSESVAAMPEAALPPPYQAKQGNRTNLSDKYQFSNFVRGHANEIALIAAQNIAKGDSSINPLFVYGSAGLGKTHLIQAIGNTYAANFPRRRVYYTSGRAFMNEVVAAFRQNKSDQFKNRYHNLDLLIVDDIQYIGGDKARTQEEFFFLFNTLHESNKSLVISCDRTPTQIKDLPQRLTTRFAAGLPTQLTPPEFEMRAQIVRQKAEERSVSLATEAVHFIAEHIKSNVRELEGAINRVSALAKFQNKEPTVEVCRMAMADLIGQANVALHPGLIKEKVAVYYHIRVSDLTSQKRQRNVVQPRHVAIYLCRQMTNHSLPEIGREFGKRNHTTILHSCRWVEERMKDDPEFCSELKHLEMSIKE